MPYDASFQLDADDLRPPMQYWRACGMPASADTPTWKGGVPPFGLDVAYFSASGVFRALVRCERNGTKRYIDAQGREGTLARGEGLRHSSGDLVCLVPGAPDRIQIVRAIFTWYTRDGLGARQIVDRLNRERIATPRDGTRSAQHRSTRWTLDTVRGIVRNPAYAAPPEPIISPATFALAQQLRTERAEAPSGRVGAIRGRGASSSYLLSGLVTCAHCGSAWRGRPPKAGSGAQTVAYACATAITKGSSACPRWLVPQSTLEGQVLREVAAALMDARVEDREEGVLILLSEAELTDGGVHLTMRGLIDAAVDGTLPALLYAWPMAAQRSLVRAFVERVIADPVARHTAVVLRAMPT